MKRMYCRLFLLVLIISIARICRGQWTEQPIPSDISFLLTVDFSNTNIGIAGGWYITGAGNRGRTLFTTDGGLSWTNGQIPDSVSSIVTLAFVAPGTAYAVGGYNIQSSSYKANKHLIPKSEYSNARGIEQYAKQIGIDLSSPHRGRFLVTTDQGRTWFAKGKLPDSCGWLNGAAFINSITGYVTESHGLFEKAHILKTINGGNTWIRTHTPDSIRYLRNITFLNSAIGISVGWQFRNQVPAGVILRTCNSGITWERQVFPQVDNFTDVFFTDSFTGLAVGVSSQGVGLIYKTTNAGITWSLLSYQPQNVILNGIRFARGSTTAIVCGSEGWFPFIARTTNAGSTWTEDSIVNGIGDGLLVSGKLRTPLVGYLCGGGISTSAVMLFTNNGGITNIIDDDDETVAGYLLSQNYPNPFNPTTKIDYEIPLWCHVTLKVYNPQGREIAVLVDRDEVPGHRSVIFDASNMASGVYFYRLQSGNFVATKKFLLLK